MDKFISDCFTNANGDWDIGRVLWAIAVLVFLALACIAVLLNKQTFDPQTFGIGLGAVMAAGGAALGMKHRTEPDPDHVDRP